MKNQRGNGIISRNISQKSDRSHIAREQKHYIIKSQYWQEENTMESFEQLWSSICDQVQLYITPTAFELWLRPLRFVNFKDGKIYLSIKEPFKRKIIISKFIDKLEIAAKEALGFEVKFEILIEGEEPKKDSLDELIKEVNRETEEEIYTFDNFINGPSNAFAYSAAQNVASNPGTTYNPLFIYGRSGVGKTHLMNAIKNYIQEHRPNTKILYFTGEHFMNEFIACIKNETNQAFREKYRNCDVLLLDDIQYIAGRTQTQEEFFHTFNALKSNGKQIVLTSDVPPRELKGIPDRLISRFEEGIIADISAPELETRVAIVKRKAEDMGVSISDETAMYIAENVRKNIRQIEGIIKKIKAYSEFTGNDANNVVAQGFIEEISSEEQPIEARVDSIINEVCRVYSVTPEDLKSGKRSAGIVFPRHVAMHIMNRVTNLTQDEIGKYFGGKDHSTVIYAIKTVNQKMEQDQSVKSTIDEIINNLNN